LSGGCLRDYRREVTLRELQGRRARRPAPAARRAAEAPTQAEHILALQRTAGNRAVTRLMRQSANLLTPQAAKAAAAEANRLYDEDSRRALKSFSGRTVDANPFTDADAEGLARLQQQLHLTPTGKADEAFFDALLKILGKTHGQRSLFIHMVVDRAGLDVSSALSVVYDGALTAAGDIQSFDGGVTEIKLGDGAFASYATMLAEIRKQLGKTPAAGAVSAVGAAVLKDPKDQQAAIAFNKAKLSDKRSIRIVQGLMGAKATGTWDADSVRHIAAKQAGAGYKADGKLELPTMEFVNALLIGNNEQDAALQVLIDYYDLDRAHAWDVRFMPQPTAGPGARAHAQTLGVANGLGGVVEIYPLGTMQPYAGLVHTLAHELGHVEQRLQGIASDAVREFLSEGIEIESKGMPEEHIESEADIDLMVQGKPVSSPGFITDCGQLMNAWDGMTLTEKTANVARFRQLRTMIVAHIGRGSTTQQAKLAGFIRRLQNADAGIP
jgi:hypothetical protein